MNSILQIVDLVIGFSSDDSHKEAVKGLQLSLQKGDTLAVVGESGSGKSVSSFSIMRLLQAPGLEISGKVLFDHAGELTDMLTIEEKVLRKIRGNEIGMVFQEPLTSLNPVIPCGKQVAEVLRNHTTLGKKAIKNRVLEMFKEVRLPDPERAFHAYPHELSGGQKQRVVIAMALICEPKLLIADEPTTALDVSVQKTIVDLLKSLQEKYEMAMIFITHDLSLAAEIAQDVIVMRHGEIVEAGKISEVFRHPKANYTKGLLACRPGLDKPLERLPVVADFEQQKKVNDQLRSPREYADGEEPILSIRKLSKSFPVGSGWFGNHAYVQALQNISFDVFANETLGIVGESGCGKSTLGRSITGLIKPETGEIAYGGKNVLNFSSKEWLNYRKDVQIIFQDPYSSLNPKQCIGDAIAEPMKVHSNLSKAAIINKTKDLLEKVGLERGHFSRYPHEFSGGQRQRIGIARALAVEPKIIVCDESVSALDVSVQAQVLNLLSDLKEEYNLSYLFVSHDLSVIRHISDRILVMREGKIEELGLAESVYENPDSAYTKMLLNSIPGSTFS